ncbi:hypothetical protein ESA94_02050 [Lacibacter luteus]|uniref:DUF4328 domain-containing protein n=1 Tax=Lacibacter luteus TaxID=2508719 RepID=A0A4Q1CMH3_9BACT|nr:hypothetical protein [Lacibacter luteus]RXK61819.1 hypothetical protein ESA94_02050 [Lacibacter luteus]
MDDIFSYGILLIPFLTFFLLIAVAVLFIYGQHRAISVIYLPSRKLNTSDVWFQLIPVFNFYWSFVVVNRLSASFAEEFDRLQITRRELYPTRAAGIASILLYFVSLIPVKEIKTLAGAGWFVCFIVYWIQIQKCRKLILDNQDNDLLDVEKEYLLNKHN